MKGSNITSLGRRAGGSDYRRGRLLVLARSRDERQRGSRRRAGPAGPGGARHGRFGAALAPVQAATATEEAVPRYLTGLGTVTAANTVTVRSRVDGQLLSLHFRGGTAGQSWRPAGADRPQPV